MNRMEIWWQYASAEGLSPFISGPWGRSDLLVSLKWGGGGVGTCERIHRKLVFSTILHNSPILSLFSELKLSRPELQWCSLARCNQPKKKPRYLSSHCPTAPGYQSLLEELSMLLPLQHKFQGPLLYAFLDIYFSSRTPVGDTRVSCFQVK